MKTIEVVCCYAREDEKSLETLVKHLRSLGSSGHITIWYDREIQPGLEWMRQIDTHLDAAAVVLLLVSPHFIGSEYCWEVQTKKVLDRHEAGKTRVIPIILHPVDWQKTPISKLQVLPSNRQPITTWRHRHQAYLDVAKGIREVVESLLREQETSSLEKSVLRLGDESKESNMSVPSSERKLSLLDESQEHRYLSIINLLYLLGFREELLGTWDSAKFERVLLRRRAQWSRERSSADSDTALAALRHLSLIPVMVRMTSDPLQRQILAEFAHSLEHLFS
jgi:hypothetical protein